MNGADGADGARVIQLAGVDTYARPATLPARRVSASEQRSLSQRIAGLPSQFGENALVGRRRIGQLSWCRGDDNRRG
jgi:hypothetical protein